MNVFEFVTPIETDRLLLRPITESDVDAVHSYQSRDDVCRYLLFAPRDRETVAARLAEYAQSLTLAKDGDYLQVAVERKSDGRMLGDIYFTIKSLEHECGEIGWTFHPDHQGQGYASEAARAMLRLGFEELRLHRIIAELDPRNVASVALCKRLGLREEAHFIEDMLVKGNWDDTGIYAMLAREWVAAGVVAGADGSSL